MIEDIFGTLGVPAPGQAAPLTAVVEIVAEAMPVSVSPTPLHVDLAAAAVPVARPSFARCVPSCDVIGGVERLVVDTFGCMVGTGDESGDKIGRRWEAPVRLGILTSCV